MAASYSPLSNECEYEDINEQYDDLGNQYEDSNMFTAGPKAPPVPPKPPGGFTIPTQWQDKLPDSDADRRWAPGSKPKTKTSFKRVKKWFKSSFMRRKRTYKGTTTLPTTDTECYSYISYCADADADSPTNEGTGHISSGLPQQEPTPPSVTTVQTRRARDLRPLPSLPQIDTNPPFSYDTDETLYKDEETVKSGEGNPNTTTDIRTKSFNNRLSGHTASILSSSSESSISLDLRSDGPSSNLSFPESSTNLGDAIPEGPLSTTEPKQLNSQLNPESDVAVNACDDPGRGARYGRIPPQDGHLSNVSVKAATQDICGRPRGQQSDTTVSDVAVNACDSFGRGARYRGIPPQDGCLSSLSVKAATQEICGRPCGQQSDTTVSDVAVNACDGPGRGARYRGIPPQDRYLNSVSVTAATDCSPMLFITLAAMVCVSLVSISFILFIVRQ